MSIKILPARLANQIAAGEVVERPASVLKELLENSIDAGATHVEIDVEKGGHKKIKVTDNGAGIPKDELMLALSRHATSKVSELDDLENICTLGFRGEALASISSVSRLALTSRTQQQSEAWQARCEGRDMQVLVEPAAHPVGTSVEVLDLFFNTPARRKFLRTEKTEFNHIEELFNRIALSRYDVGLRLKHNGKVLKNLPGITSSEDALKRVKQLFGSRICEGMVEVSGEYQGFKLTGWLSTPQQYRAMNDVQFVFVNNRMMRDKLIFHAIRQSYEGLLPEDKFPFFVLYLQVPHNEVDVNVHPAKHEVRFHQSRLVHDFIFSTINDALSQTISNGSASHGKSHGEAAHQYFSTDREVQHQKEPSVQQEQPNTDYIQPLQTGSYAGNYQSRPSNHGSSGAYQAGTILQNNSKQVREAASNYTTLMSVPDGTDLPSQSAVQNQSIGVQTGATAFLDIPDVGVIVAILDQHYLINKAQLCMPQLESIFASGVSQPLLLPVSIATANKVSPVLLDLTEEIGMDVQWTGKKLILKQVPAGTRNQNWQHVMSTIVDRLDDIDKPTLLEILASAWHMESSLGDIWVALSSPEQEFMLKQQAAPLPLKSWLLEFAASQEGHKDV